VTIANRLTLARLAAAPPAFACLWSRNPKLYAAALGLYLLAILTDGLDGWIARKTGQVSAFGALADPVADKVLVIGAFIAFLRIPDMDVPDWAVFLIIARELLLGALRALSAVQGTVLSADLAGKWSMAVQSVCVLWILTWLALSANGVLLPDWTSALPHPLILLCLAVSWSSGALYFYRARRLLRSSWQGGTGPGMKGNK
jgi:CDP-diacylglycerol--glycerol-3-phosphate 3-phosphatidyltransferase